MTTRGSVVSILADGAISCAWCTNPTMASPDELNAVASHLLSRPHIPVVLSPDSKHVTNEPVLYGPRPFVLVRDEDVSGVSGTGVVAGGCVFDDGTAVLRWYTEAPTSVVFHDNGIESIKKVHGHDGRTRIVYATGEEA